MTSRLIATECEKAPKNCLEIYCGASKQLQQTGCRRENETLSTNKFELNNTVNYSTANFI